MYIYMYIRICIYIYIPGARRRQVRRMQGPSSASLGLTDYSRLGMLALRYNSVNFGADKSLGSIFA